MLLGKQTITRELRRGLICALLIATLWIAIYFLMGVSTMSAVLAAIAAAAVRLAIPNAKNFPVSKR
jgi:hypothetical protein